MKPTLPENTVSPPVSLPGFQGLSSSDSTFIPTLFLHLPYPMYWFQVSKYASPSSLYVWNISWLWLYFGSVKSYPSFQIQLKCHLLHKAFPKHLNLKILALCKVGCKMAQNYLVKPTTRSAGSHQYWLACWAKFIHLSQEWIEKRDTGDIKKQNLCSVFIISQ